MIVKRILAAAVLLCAPGVRAQSAAPVFDLSGLPAYPVDADTPQLHGVVRIHGTELTQHLVHLWEDGFLKHHPLVRFADYFLPSGFSGLTAGTADINVMGHAAWRSDLTGFESAFGYDPFEITFATGGFNLRKGNTPAAIFFVNKDNPLHGMTLEQIDGVFGAERSGGWVGAHWTTASARGPEKNIRTWGQLGLTGAWADKPIHLYGIDATLSGWSGMIQEIAFHGGDKWNPALNEIVRGGVEVPADAQIVAAVAEDKYAIGFNLMRVVEKNPGVRPLAIAKDAASPMVMPTAQSCYARTYPFVNSVYLYMKRAPGAPIEPTLKAFLEYTLSREGQQLVAEDGMFIPLNPQADAEQRRRLQ